MRMATIASGSSGNCIYVSSDHCNLLIDAGISMRRIESGLAELGLTPADMDGILITHEHSDHVGGLGPLLRKYHLPLYTTEGTLEALSAMKALGTLPSELARYVSPGTVFSIGDMDILPTQVPHDAAQPVIYRMESSGAAMAVATDFGYATDAIRETLSGLDAMILEANHDIRMLQVGPYPYMLKQRILSNSGHMSNEAAGKLLCEINCDRLKTVMLGHLSKTNNYAELAYETVRLELTLGDTSSEAPELLIAPRSGLSQVIETGAADNMLTAREMRAASSM